MLECTFYTRTFGSARIVDGGTQSMPLSAAIKNSTSAEGVDGTFQHATVSRRDKHCLSAFGAEVAEPAQRATELARRRGSCRAIEADLRAISPGGRAAAGDGRGGLAEGERAF